MRTEADKIKVIHVTKRHLKKSRHIWKLDYNITGLHLGSMPDNLTEIIREINILFYTAVYVTWYDR